MRRIPHLLLLTRLVLGPVLLVGGLRDWGGTNLAGILVLATLTDVFDGVSARRLGVATEWLRRADSFVDTVFYTFVAILLVLRYPAVFQLYWPGLAIIVALEVGRALFDHNKYGRQAAYHMWSAKLWGLALLFGFSELFISGQAGPLLLGAIVIGAVTDIEGLAASLVLPDWHCDVPSIVHALSRRREILASAR